MALHYMDDGFGPFAGRSFDAAAAHLESLACTRNGAGIPNSTRANSSNTPSAWNRNGPPPSQQNSSPKPSPSQAPPAKPTAKDPLPCTGAQSYWEILKELIDSIHDQ